MAPSAENENEMGSEGLKFESLDAVLRAIGAFGRYQIYFLLLGQFSLIVWCGNFVFMSYATYVPQVTCSLANGTKIQLNTSDSADFCDIYEKGGCQDLHWEAPFYTIIQEWALICGKDDIPETINSIQMAGVFVGMAFSGIVSDHLGRKPVTVVSFGAFLLAGIGSTMAKNLIVFAIGRFIVGGTLMASIVTSVLWSMESTTHNNSIIFNIGQLWQFAYIITALIAYLIPRWHSFLLAINGIGIPFLVLFIFLQESPRWLLQTGKIEATASVLQKIAKCNGKDVISIQPQDMPAPVEQTRKYSCLTLFSRKILAKYTMVLILIGFTASMIDSTFFFQISFLPGNPFFKFFIYGVVRIWVPFFIFFLDRKLKWFGRRYLISVPLVLCWFCYVIVTIGRLLHLGPSVTFYGCITGAVVNCVFWVALSQYELELFPTVIRNTAVTVIVTVQTSSGVLVPQMIYLEKYWPPLPFVMVLFFCTASFLSAVVFLPETKDREIPESLEDLEEKPTAGSDGELLYDASEVDQQNVVI